MKVDLEKAYFLGQQNSQIILAMEDINNTYNILMSKIQGYFENYPELRKVYSFDI